MCGEYAFQEAVDLPRDKYVMNERMNGVFTIIHTIAVWKECAQCIEITRMGNTRSSFLLDVVAMRDDLSSRQFIM